MTPLLYTRTLILIICVALAGCRVMTDHSIPPQESFATEEKIISVVLIDGRLVEFADDGGRPLADFDLEARTVEGDSIRIRGTDVLQFRRTSPDFIADVRALRNPTQGGKQERGNMIHEALLKDGTLELVDPPGAALKSRDVLVIEEKKRDISIKLTDVAGVRVATPPRLSHRDIAGGARPAEAILRGTHRWLRFDTSGVRISNVRRLMAGMTVDGLYVAIPMDSITSGTVERTSIAGSILATVVVVVLSAATVVGLFFLLKQSCPFLYSWDGKEFVFDAEPLGGATSAGLARTDLSRMEHLAAVNGEYRLSVRNEVEETQYVDRLALLYCDHDSALRPVADGPDGLVLVGRQMPPDAAVDELGTDVRCFFAARDGIMWQTHMASVANARPDSVRHALRFVFRKPAGSTRATVVVHGGTTLWGSGMIKVMYELQGENLERWHAEADRKGPGLYRTLMFLDREELYTMRLYAKVAGRWKERGTITGGGPLEYETQTLSFPVSGIAGDSLELLIRPPKGFWAIDEISVSYETPERRRLTPLRLVGVTDQNGNDIRHLLLAEDGMHYVMPTKRERALMVFEAPPVREGCVRSIFARTSGYYRLHITPEGPGDPTTIAAIEKIPGEVVRLSLKKYREWSARMASLTVPADTLRPHE